jgi:hypothetical protein
MFCLNTSLVKAIEANDLDRIQVLLTKNNLDDLKDYVNIPKLLTLAVEKNRFEIFKFMVEHPQFATTIDEKYVDIWETTFYTNLEKCFMMACQIGALKITSYLDTIRKLSIGCKQVAFICAIDNMHPHIVKYFIKNGYPINPHSTTCLSVAAEHGDMELIQMIFDFDPDVDLFCPYLSAAGNGQLHILELFDAKYVARGLINSQSGHAVPNIVHTIAVEYAAKWGQKDTLLYLFDRFDLTSHVTRGFINAAKANKDDVMKLFIGLGADIHHCNDEALIACASNGNFEMVKYLIEMGIQAKGRENLLICSAESGNVKLLKFFLNSGFDLERKNHILMNDSLIERITRKGYLEMLIFILLTVDNFNKYAPKIIKNAIISNHVHIVDYALMINNSLHTHVNEFMESAAKNNSIKSLKCMIRHYLFYKGDRENLLLIALEHKHYDMADFITENILNLEDIAKLSDKIKSFPEGTISDCDRLLKVIANTNTNTNTN